MTVIVNKGTPLSMPEVQAEPEINVVTYDDNNGVVEPQTVVAVPIEDNNNMMMNHQHHHALPPPTTTSVPPTTTASSTTVNNNSTSSHNHNSDRGCEAVLCGDTRLRRISPGFNLFISLCGNTDIDIHDASFSPEHSKLKIINLRLCGNTNLLVPPGTRVVVRRLLLCGNRDIFVEDADQNDDDPERQGTAGTVAPRITLTIFSLCGDICVRSDPNEMPDSFAYRRSLSSS